MKFEATQLHK